MCRDRERESLCLWREVGKEKETEIDRVYVLRERRGEKERISSERETIPRSKHKGSSMRHFSKKGLE